MAEIINVGTPGQGSSTTPSVAKPTGTEEGDLVVLGLSLQSSTDSTTVTPPSGFTEHVDSGNPTGNLNGTRVRFYSKVAGASEPETYDFTLSASTDWVLWSGLADLIDIADPIMASNTNQQTSTGTLSLGSLTVSGDGALFVIIGASRGTPTMSTTPSTTSLFATISQGSNCTTRSWQQVETETGESESYQIDFSGSTDRSGALIALRIASDPGVTLTLPSVL